MKSDKLRQFFVMFSIITLIVMNYLSNTGAFGGQTNKVISNKYHTLITPAGYAFSIWGIIFLGLLGFAIYQGLSSQQENPRFRAIGWWVVLNAFCNAAWSPLFNNERIGIALLVILVMLFSLVVIEQQLLVRRSVRGATTPPLVDTDPDATLPESPASPTETWLARIPFSIYFGWLTIATILNVTVYLKSTDFSLVGLSEQAWAMGMLIVGLVVGAIVFNRYRSVAYILVFTWAYVAIAAEQKGYSQVQLIAGAGAIVAVGLAISGIISKKTPAYS